MTIPSTRPSPATVVLVVGDSSLKDMKLFGREQLLGRLYLLQNLKRERLSTICIPVLLQTVIRMATVPKQ